MGGMQRERDGVMEVCRQAEEMKEMTWEEAQEGPRKRECR